MNFYNKLTPEIVPSPLMKNETKIEEFYVAQFEALNREQININRTSSIISWMRLVVFLSTVCFIWLGFSYSQWIFIGAALSFAGFLFLVKLFLKKQFEKELGQTKIEIVKNEIASLKNQPGFWYNGEKYHSTNSYSYDLDVFGEFSLFHFANRCGTEAGEEQLAHQFLNGNQTKESIIQLQESIQEFTQKNEFRLEWQGLGRMLPTHAKMNEKLQQNLSFKNEFSNSLLVKVLMFLGPIQILGSLTYYLVSDVSQPLLYSFVFTLFITSFFLRKVNLRQKSIDGLQKILTSYNRMIHAYSNEKWDAKTNATIQNELHSAQGSFAKLAEISEWFDRRMNVVAGITFNGFVLYDLHCALRLEKWKEQHHENCFKWFGLIAEIDALQSMGTFAFNHPSFNLPEITHKNEITAESIAHPLIPVSKNISNDFNSIHPEKIILITGSNMSGKSTFLRTIGLNLILAQAGMPVNAKQMKFTPMQIQTSLRQTDNLHENVSLFHAELIRLKSIRDHLKKGKLTLVLLDEMLRGTNSEDKLSGSRQLIEELSKENIFAIIATHDLELGKLEDRYKGIIRNMCFESVITQNELIFDYKLKPGVARNKNATFLLNKMEIIHSEKQNAY